MSKVAVAGAGYVGLTTAACLADLGNDVCVVDIDAEKVRRLRRHRIPFYEPGLQEVVERNSRAGRLRFTASYPEAVAGADFLFIAVSTPEGEGGQADVSAVEAAAAAVAEAMQAPLVIVNKSTVPIGTGDMVSETVKKHNGQFSVDVVSNPEFLREGSALVDFLKPDRVVIGAHRREAAEKVAELYKPLQAPVLITDIYTAEMIKYASNAFLATRISFINEVARIAERVDADIKVVAEGMGLDRRIGPHFLDAGIGYGGSCLVGEETVLVRRSGKPKLVSLERLYAELEDGERAEVLAWRLDATTPEFLPIKAATRRVVRDEILEVRTKMGRRVRCTRDHPFVTLGGTKLADELTTSDWLPLAVLSPPARGVGRFDVLDGLAAARLEPHDVIVRPAAGVLTLGRSLQPTLAVAHSQPLTIAPDAAFWRVVGLYIAEGHVSSDGARSRLSWSFHPHDEDDLVEEVRCFWANKGVKVDVRRLPTTTSVSISSRLLAGFWLGSLGLGANAYMQRLPDAIWDASIEHKRAVLAGLWRGDGSWSYQNGGPSVVLEYGTVSRELADGILRLLADLGFVASLRTGRGRRSTCDTYWIRVCGADQVEQLLDLVAPQDRDIIRTSLARQSKRIAPTGYRRGSAHTAWVRVVGVEERSFDGAVYSLEVPGAHTFVTTGGLVTHNCFPKDVKALAAIAELYDYHPELLHAVMDINRDMRVLAIEKLRECLGTLRNQVIGLLGLAFKPNTDDLRQAPSLEIARLLLSKGAEVRAYDPAATAGARDQLPEVEYRRNAYAVARGADALLLVTEWNEFRQLDMLRIKRSMRRPVLVDGRNIYDPAKMREMGFVYRGIGRN